MKFKNDVADDCFIDDFEVEAMELQEACDFLGVNYNKLTPNDDFCETNIGNMFGDELRLD